MNPTRVAIYARISSDDGSALGVRRQITDCEELALRNGWQLAERYVDNDVSASNGKRRPQFERLLADVRRGQIDGVVVWDIDRLTRTPSELEEFIVIADAHRLALASVGGEVDLGTPQGRLTARIKGNVARHEVEQSSRRLKRKFLERAQAGKPHGKVAYGYRRVTALDSDGQVVGTRDIIDDEQAVVVRDAARRVLAHESVRSIVADLNNREVPSPRGARWEGAMLRQVLLRERNAGRRVHRGEVVGPGDWEPLYDEGTHDRVVALLTDPSRRRSRGNDVTHLLSGLANCGLCGGTMRVNVGRLTTSGKRQPPAYTCGQCFRVRRKESSVDEVVSGIVVARLEEPDGPDLLAGDAEAMRQAGAEVEAFEARLNRAADDYAEGGITAEQLKRITARLAPKISEARARQRAAAPSPELARVIGSGSVRVAWDAATIEVQRAVIGALMDVAIMPAGSGKSFDPQCVRVQWRTDAR